MKRFDGIAIYLLFAMIFLTLLGIDLASTKPEWDGMEKASFYYESPRRPFNWYYPYSFRYYYPRRQYTSSYSCYWVYTNGTYIYRCH